MKNLIFLWSKKYNIIFLFTFLFTILFIILFLKTNYALSTTSLASVSDIEETTNIQSDYDTTNELDTINETLQSNIDALSLEEKNIYFGTGLYGISDYTPYNKSEKKENYGKIINEYYSCALILNNKNVVEQIQFDHINFRVDYSLSNLYFNNTGLSETKKLISDKQKSGTNFSLSDGSKIDIIALEKKLIEIGDFDDIMKYLNKDAYKMLPLLACFSEAYTNAKSNEQIQNGFLGSFLYSDIRNRENLNLNSNTYFASIIINKNKKINKSNIKQIIINEKINEVGMLNNREKTIDYTSTENEEHNKNLLSFENLSIEEFIYKISNDTNYNDTNFQYLYALGKAMLKAINH